MAIGAFSDVPYFSLNPVPVGKNEICCFFSENNIERKPVAVTEETLRPVLVYPAVGNGSSQPVGRLPVQADVGVKKIQPSQVIPEPEFFCDLNGKFPVQLFFKVYRIPHYRILLFLRQKRKMQQQLDGCEDGKKNLSHLPHSK
jgi:hypothetical protein